MGSIVQVQLNPAALKADGSYVSESIDSQVLPSGPNSGLVALPGAANWGPTKIVQYFSDYDSGVPLFGDTQIGLSSGGVDYGIMARVALMQSAASAFAAVRVTDGTDVAATSQVPDNSSSYLFKFTGKYTGSYGNRIGYLMQLQSGTQTSYPVYRITIYPPAGNAEVFSNIVAYTTGGTYSATTFITNALAAINGTNNTPASRWVIAASIVSPSSNPPALPANAQLLANGTDGNAGLTDSIVVGVSGPVGTRTGVYAFSGQIAGGTVMLPGVTSFSSFATLATFCALQPCIFVWGNFAAGTLTAAAIADCQTNNLVNQRGMLFTDWVEFVDPVTGLTRWLEPAAGGAAAIAATPPWVYVGNKPENVGMPNILATEATITGLPIDTTEAANRESNGLNWFAPGGPGGSGPFRTFHGMMSDGVTLSSDVRMADVICLNIQQILTPFVGKMQSLTGNDVTGVRSQARAKVNEYMSSISGQISDYECTLDSTNNTPLTVGEGLLLCALQVVTLGVVRFAIGAVDVGTGVQILVAQLS